MIVAHFTLDEDETNGELKLLADLWLKLLKSANSLAFLSQRRWSQCMALAASVLGATG